MIGDEITAVFREPKCPLTTHQGQYLRLDSTGIRLKIVRRCIVCNKLCVRFDTVAMAPMDADCAKKCRDTLSDIPVDDAD